MLQLPIPLSGPQQDRLSALLMRGDPQFVILDHKVNGQEVYVLIAVGEARTWAMETLYGAEPSEEPVMEPPAPKHTIATGAHQATVKPRPITKRSLPS